MARFPTAEASVGRWRWAQGFLHVTISLGRKKPKDKEDMHVCLLIQQVTLQFFHHLQKERIDTYLTGSYSWPDCVIIALILSSSEALASARLAVCLTGNYLTHTLETHLSPHSQRQHHSSNPVKSSTTLAEVAWTQLLYIKSVCPEDVLGSPYAITWCLRACQPTWKEHSWALKTLGSVCTLHQDLCNQSNFLPSGLKLCVDTKKKYTIQYF